jgi:hypothetical protein
MKKKLFILLISIMVSNLFFAPVAIRAENFHLSKIDYSRVSPQNYVLQDNYGGMGIDRAGWVYHAIDGYYKGVQIEDTAVFRFHSITGEKEFLGTLRDISAAEGNLLPGEEISKIHAPIYEHKNIIYFASHSFHKKEEIQRGGHFYSFDPDTKKWTDLSKFEPDGTSTPGQGIITMDVLRKYDKLVGFTFPKGELVIFDLKKKKTTNYGRPILDDPLNVSRHIITTNTGKVYFSYSGYNQPLYEFDINTKLMKKTGFILKHGWLSGVTRNSTGTKVYFIDWFGELYVLNVKTEKFSKLGKMLPDSHSNYKYRWLHGLIISNDNDRLYSLPKVDTGSQELYILYEYIIDKKKIKQAYITDLKGHVVGVVLSKKGDLYFHNHNYKKKYSKLIQIKLLE